MHCLNGVRSQGKQRPRLHGTPLAAPCIARQIPSFRLAYRLLTHFHKPSHRAKLQGAVLFATSTDDPSLTTSPQGTSLARAELPTFFERLASALMFVLPLSEGAHRMTLSFVQYCKKEALGFMYWCHHQHRQVSLALAAKTAVDYSREDIVTLQTLMQMSERLHQWFSNWSMQLADLSRPIQSFRETALGSGWLSVAVGTPEALWQLGCVFYMSLVAGLAALKINNLSNKKGKNN